MARTDSTGEREPTLPAVLEQRGNVVPFAVQYERRGQEKGLARGLREGREEIRGMHVRLARARFGEGCRNAWRRCCTQ